MPMGGGAGPSEFTRMLGAIGPSRAAAPPPPPLPIAPAAAPAPPAGGAASQGGGGIKSYLPLILGLNVLLIALMGVVLYFALKR